MKPNQKIPKKKEQVILRDWFIIRNKSSYFPWSMTMFSSKKEAKKYFEKKVKENKWNFSWRSFEVIPVTITYEL